MNLNDQVEQAIIETENKLRELKADLRSDILKAVSWGIVAFILVWIVTR